MKSKFFFLAMLVLLTIACKQAETKQQQVTAPSTTTAVPTWDFKTAAPEAEGHDPKAEVFLNQDGTIHKVADGFGTFAVLEKSEYASHKIPGNAVSACMSNTPNYIQKYVLVDSSDWWVVKQSLVGEAETPFTTVFRTPK